MVNATLADTFCTLGEKWKGHFHAQVCKCGTLTTVLYKVYIYCIQVWIPDTEMPNLLLCDKFVINFLVVAVFCAFAFKIRPKLLLRKSICV